MGEKKDLTIREKEKLLASSLEKLSGSVSSPEAPFRIPKIIHQIWLGGQLPEGYKAWQQTWKKFNPDWEYRLWTDELVKNHKWIKRDVLEKTKNYGPKSDILRFEIIYKYGGLYADTDFECLKSFDNLHKVCDLYAARLEDGNSFVAASCIFGACAGHPVVKACIDGIEKPYNSLSATDLVFLWDSPYFSGKLFENFNSGGYRNLVLPPQYFYPFPGALRQQASPDLVKQYIKPESYAVHYWETSWDIKKKGPYKLMHKLLPQPVKNFIKRLYKKN